MSDDTAAGEPRTLEDGTPVRLAVQCRRCHGWIHSPGSVAARIGPVCARHERTDARRKAAANELGLFDIVEPPTATAQP